MAWVSAGARAGMVELAAGERWRRRMVRAGRRWGSMVAQTEHPDFLHVVIPPCIDKLNQIAFANGPVHNFKVSNYPAKRVEN